MAVSANSEIETSDARAIGRLASPDFNAKKRFRNRVALFIATITLLSSLVLMYVWMPNMKWPNFEIRAHHLDVYNMLTDSFLSRHLFLDQEVPPGLLTLDDPYEPSTNYQYRSNFGLWDESLYNGKFYIYFGVSPVIAFYLPYRILTGLRLPSLLAILVAGSGTLIFATALLHSIRRRYFPASPSWMFLLGVAFVGCCDLGCYLACQPYIYQVAISSGMFFSMGAMYFLSRALGAFSNWRKSWFVLSGLFLALAIGSRPHFALTGGIIFAIAIVTMWQRGERRWSQFAALSASSGTGVFLLGLYNWLRFDSFFEFGSRYQLSIINMNRVGMFDFHRVKSSLYFWFLQPPTINRTFPYFHPMPELPSWIAKPEHFFLERIVGFPLITPFFLLIIPLALGLAWRRRKQRSLPFPKLEMTWIATSVLLVLALLSLASATMRYLADFLAWLDVAAIVAWFYVDQRIHPRLRIPSRVLAVLLIVVSAVIGVLLALPPPKHYMDG